MISTQFVFPSCCGVYFVCMVIERTFILSFLFASFFAVFSFSAGVVYAHGGEEHSGLVSQVSVCHSLSELERISCYIAACESDVVEECLEDIVDAAVEGSGPKFANAVLGDLDTFGLLAGVDVSLNSLAQRIGRVMAQRYADGDPMTFMDCDTDYHYGCHYGFFTEVLSAGDVSPDVVSVDICDADASQQERCYHRMGHMFLKHHAHTLPPALSLCDAMPDAFQEHCWDGVFMENVNELFFSGGARGEGFLAEDSFAPCSIIAERYRKQCYKNHGRYLIDWFSPCDVIPAELRKLCYGEGRYLTDWFEANSRDVLEICDTVDDAYIKVCRHSIRDALSGEDGHHTHDGEMGGHERADSRSWFQKIIDFVVGLFSGGSSSERAVDRKDAERRAAALVAVPDQSADRSDLAAVPVSSSVSPDGAVPAEIELGAGSALSLAFAFPEGVAPSAVGHNALISYRDGQFVPNEVRIKPGQRVLWVNEDQVFWPASNLHPTHREYPGSGMTKCGTDERVMIFDACEAMGPGVAYTFQFNEVGEWKFHDHINPRATGTVIVSE